MAAQHLVERAVFEVKVLEEQRREYAKEHADERRADKDERKVEQRHERRARSVREANELGKRREEHDRDGVVEHALAKDDVEQRRVDVELLENRERRHGVLRTSQSTSQSMLRSHTTTAASRAYEHRAGYVLLR